MSSQYFSADLIYSHGQLFEQHAIAVEDGRVTNLAPRFEVLAQLPEGAQITHFENSFLLPGFVNSHNHSFQSLLKGFCDDADFFTWRDQALYKYATVLDWDGLYTGALFAFTEMIKTGITTVCDFFYINDQGNENAQAIIQAAKDLGIRLVFARTLYDWDGAPKRFQETIQQAVGNTSALMSEFNCQPDQMTTVIPAPHSLHGASAPLIEAGRDLARQHETMFHMHIAEGEYERQMMLEKHGLSPIRFLDKLGVLNERLVGIHCVWLDDEEIQLMADRKTGLSYNPSSNMFLGDGITRITEMLKAGVRISLGTDGGCSNNRASIIEEMRMTSLLQKVKWCNATVTKAEDMMVMATDHGGQNLGLPVGRLQPGYWADFTVIDLNDLSMQPRQNALKNLVYASQPSAIQAVYVAGQPIYHNQRLVKIPETRIIEKIQAITGSWR